MRDSNFELKKYKFCEMKIHIDCHIVETWMYCIMTLFICSTHFRHNSTLSFQKLLSEGLIVVPLKTFVMENFFHKLKQCSKKLCVLCV